MMMVRALRVESSGVNSTVDSTPSASRGGQSDELESSGIAVRLDRRREERPQARSDGERQALPLVDMDQALDFASLNRIHHYRFFLLDL